MDLQRYLNDPVAVTLILTSAIAVALFIYLLVSTVRIRNLRRIAFSKFASATGFSFAEKLKSYSDTGLPETRLLGVGFDNSYRNIIRGEVRGAAVVAFDHGFVMVSGRSTTKREQTVVAISIKDSGLPSFSVMQKDLIHKIGDALRPKGIDLDRFPEFSKKYLLSVADENEAGALFGSKAINLYMDKLACEVEVCDGWLFLYQIGKHLMALEVQERIDATFEFLQELKHGQEG